MKDKTRKTLKDLVKPIDSNNPFNQPQHTVASTAMEGTARHTPTPWKIARPTTVYLGPHVQDQMVVNEIVGIEKDNVTAWTLENTDAQFIVRAVNSHEELVERLKELADVAEILQKEPASKSARLTILNTIDNAREVIAKAEGK